MLEFEGIHAGLGSFALPSPIATPSARLVLDWLGAVLQSIL